MYEFLYHLKLTAANSRGLSNNHHTLGNSKGTIPVDGTGYPECYAFFGGNGKVVFMEVQHGQWYTPSNYLFVARNNNNGRNFFAFYQYFEQRKR